MTQEKLKEAKRLYQTANAYQRYMLESLFPELAWSEDEKIRKEIIATIKDENVPSWKTAEKCGFELAETKMYKDIDDEKEELYRFYVKRN